MSKSAYISLLTHKKNRFPSPIFLLFKPQTNTNIPNSTSQSSSSSSTVPSEQEKEKSMDHKPDHKVPRPNDRNNLHHHHHKMPFTEFNLEDLKRSNHVLVSSPSQSQSAATKAPSSAKGNCLCSPTTHIGSFRCRHHRHSGMFRGGSVGSNLSDLARKSTEIREPYSP